MDTKDIRLVLALAEHRHFARAAKACSISQPAFSARIQSLEQELGVRLVERGARFERFTPEGTRLLVRLREIMAILDGLKQEATAASGAVAGHLRIAVIPTQLTVAGELAARLLAQHVGIRVSIQSRSSAAIDAALDHYEADIGISYGGEGRPERFRTDKMAGEAYMLLASSALIGTRTSLAWRAAAELPLGLLSPEMQNRRIIDGVFRELGVAPKIRVESDTFGALVGAARTGSIAVVLPAAQAALYATDATLRLARLHGPIVEREIALVSLRRTPDLPTVAAARLAAADLGKPKPI